MITSKWLKRGAPIRNILESTILGRAKLQWFFRNLHLFAIAGLNYGEGSEVGSSGEWYAMQWFYKRWGKDAPPVVFDVGANIGKYSVAMCETFHNNLRLYAFEPSKATYTRLCETATGLPVKTFNLGMSDKVQELTLYSNQEASGIASVYARTTVDNLRPVETINLTSLDLFCSAKDIKHIDYLKLDVEGHEINVLKGASKMLESDAIDVIQFEFGGCNVDSRTYFNDFWLLLHEQYDLYRILRDGLCLITQYSLLDEIFVTVNFLAVRKIGK